MGALVLIPFTVSEITVNRSLFVFLFLNVFIMAVIIYHLIFGGKQ